MHTILSLRSLPRVTSVLAQSPPPHPPRHTVICRRADLISRRSLDLYAPSAMAIELRLLLWLGLVGARFVSIISCVSPHRSKCLPCSRIASAALMTSGGFAAIIACATPSRPQHQCTSYTRTLFFFFFLILMMLEHRFQINKIDLQ